MNQGSVSASRPEGRKVGSSIGAFVSWDSVVVFMGIIFVLNCVEGGCESVSQLASSLPSLALITTLSSLDGREAHP